MPKTAGYWGQSGIAFETKHYQFVSYFPKWCGINYECYNPKETDWAYIYEWILRIGFWHIRKWSKLGF